VGVVLVHWVTLVTPVVHTQVPLPVGREKIGQTGVRIWGSLNLVRVHYRYATQPMSGGIINSNTPLISFWPAT
jgi:hypothetical protein